MIRIVHLSDIHFSNNSIPKFHSEILNPLLGDLEVYNNEKKIDFVIISGDLIDRGGSGFVSISDAFEQFKTNFIDKLATTLRITNDRFFLAPGNHDVDSSADSQYTEKGLKSELLNEEKVVDFMVSSPINNLQRMNGFKNFEKTHFNDFSGEKKLTHFNSIFLFECEGIKIGINAFNTSWRYYPKLNESNLLIGKEQFENASDILEKADVKIAVFHHGFDDIFNFDKKAIFPIYQQNYNLAFFGHVHSADNNYIGNPTGHVIQITAPSNWYANINSTDLEMLNGYSVVDYDPSKKIVDIHSRCYSKLKRCYIPNVHIGDNNGKSTFRSEVYNEKSKYNVESRIQEHIEITQLILLDEHLINYSYNTKAPKRISQLFVNPRVFTYKKDKDNEVKEEFVDINKIMSPECHYLIFGTKEIGKTILLDYIYIETVKNITITHKIPVYFDFTLLRNQRFETIISHELGVKITEIKDFMLKNEIIFLVDNLSFEEKDSNNRQRLFTYIKENNIFLIATSSQLSSGTFPLRFMETVEKPIFSTLHIKEFNAHQIKDLIGKWFCNNDDFNKPEQCTKVLNILKSLNLPGSPLAVSMFLLIIEQQKEYRPQNEAMMLENFIEKTLDKASKRPILSENFDYTNKLHLLSEIAYKMYKKDSEGYLLRSSELISFIQEKFDAKRLDFNPTEVVDEYLDRGILVHEGAEIRFRFTCFFEFFLMKRMEFDPTFLSYVLSEQNFLFFQNELTYYTGIKRNNKDILEKVIKYMEESFQKLIHLLKEKSKGYDIIFSKNGNPIINNLSDDWSKKLCDQRSNRDEEILDNEDTRLDQRTKDEIIKKKNKELSPFQILERSWVLAARILKNSEEIEEPDLKSKSFMKIIESSLAYAVLFKIIIVNDIINKNEDTTISKQEKFFCDYLPLLHQMVLSKVLGTAKLNLIIRERLDAIIKNNKVTDFEKFVIVFMYSDLKGKESIKYIKDFINEIKQGNIFDITLFKLLHIYYFESKDVALDNKLENLIGNLKIKATNQKESAKGKIIQIYKKSRYEQKRHNRIED